MTWMNCSCISLPATQVSGTVQAEYGCWCSRLAGRGYREDPDADRSAPELAATIPEATAESEAFTRVRMLSTRRQHPVTLPGNGWYHRCNQPGAILAEPVSGQHGESSPASDRDDEQVFERRLLLTAGAKRRYWCDMAPPRNLAANPLLPAALSRTAVRPGLLIGTEPCPAYQRNRWRMPVLGNRGDRERNA